jgi:hypothetical protein
MLPLVVVLVAGGILGVATPIVLGRLERLDRAPQAAVYLWMLATVGALLAIVLAGVLLVVGSSRLLTDLAMLLRTCTMALREALDAPTGAPVPLVGLALLALVAGGLLAGGLVAVTRAWRAARAQRELLTLAGRTEPGLPGVTILTHPVPPAYCLPGRSRGRAGAVVVTTATLEQFEPGQLGAVLAHERAHQTVATTPYCWSPRPFGSDSPGCRRPGPPTRRSPAWSSWRLTTTPSTATAVSTSPPRSPSSPPHQLRPCARRRRPDHDRACPPAHHPTQGPGRGALAGRPGRDRADSRGAVRPDHSAAQRGRHAGLPDHLTRPGA